MKSPSAIHNTQYAGQPIDFSGLRETYTRRLGTDVDFFAEYDNRVFIFGELKFRGAALPDGQAAALMRLVHALNRAGKVAVLLHLAHWTPAPHPVDAASAQVLAAFFRGQGQSAPGWHGVTAGCDMHLSDAILFFTREAGITPPVQYLPTTIGGNSHG